MCEELVRPNWDNYFLNIAREVAKRSTCDRAHVGCVLVKEGRIISTGFNGAPTGQPHCDEVGHLMVSGHCVRTVHAEVNAIIQAALNSSSPAGSVCYATHFPCYTCAKMLINAKIVRIVFNAYYGASNEYTMSLFRTTNIEIVLGELWTER